MNKKLADFQKKKERLGIEIERCRTQLKKVKQQVDTKENELKQIDADIVACLLVENQITVDDLADLLTSSGKNM